MHLFSISAAQYSAAYSFEPFVRLVRLFSRRPSAKFVHPAVSAHRAHVTAGDLRPTATFPIRKATSKEWGGGREPEP